MPEHIHVYKVALGSIDSRWNSFNSLRYVDSSLYISVSLPGLIVTAGSDDRDRNLILCGELLLLLSPESMGN